MIIRVRPHQGDRYYIDGQINNGWHTVPDTYKRVPDTTREDHGVGLHLRF